MKRCICNRCKELFDPTNHQVSSIELKVYDSNHFSWPNGYIYDFCKSCTKEIIRCLEQITKK